MRTNDLSPRFGAMVTIDTSKMPKEKAHILSDMSEAWVNSNEIAPARIVKTVSDIDGSVTQIIYTSIPVGSNPETDSFNHTHKATQTGDGNIRPNRTKLKARKKQNYKAANTKPKPALTDIFPPDYFRLEADLYARFFLMMAKRALNDLQAPNTPVTHDPDKTLIL